jgi:hypothetical protein
MLSFRLRGKNGQDSFYFFGRSNAFFGCFKTFLTEVHSSYGQLAYFSNIFISGKTSNTVKLRAVDQSAIQFLTIFGVLLTKTCYYPRRATIAMSSNQSTDEYIKGCNLIPKSSTFPTRM